MCAGRRLTARVWPGDGDSQERSGVGGALCMNLRGGCQLHTDHVKGTPVIHSHDPKGSAATPWKPRKGGLAIRWTGHPGWPEGNSGDPVSQGPCTLQTPGRAEWETPSLKPQGCSFRGLQGYKVSRGTGSPGSDPRPAIREPRESAGPREDR